MGKQHGEMLHDIIGEAMEFVADDPILSSIPAVAAGMGILEIAADNSYPDLLEECQGLVDATADVGFTMDFCLALNFGDVMLEFIDNGGVPDARLGGPGCSEVIASGAATPDGRTYHARNLDWGSMNIEIIHDNPVVFVRQPADGIAHVYVGFPLNLSPYTGMNAEGISICSNEAEPASEAELSRSGRSHVQMLGQILKRSSSLAEARSFLEGEKHMSAEILTVADGKAGDGAVFEMTAAHMAELPLADGVVIATNHFIAPEMADYDAPQNEAAGDSSLLRLERLRQLVLPDGEETLYGELSLDNLAQVMHDRVNPRDPERTPAPYNDANVDNDAGLATNGPMHFVLFDPAKLLFWVAAGKDPEGGKPYVSQQPYTCFSLGELLGLPDAEVCEAEML
ncbi:MAG: hypothetical protein C4523_20645 [Myxococcales bacterium]|nr:MAG: hypothetical protein C4523_20645 [Myxococcales bacterium]